MAEFFCEYGLFALKALTLVILIVIGISLIATIIATKQKDRESIEIEKLNDHFENLQDALEAEILPKDEYKKLSKERKKQHKKAKKSLKKSGKEEEAKQRVFVLKFEGDIHASEVDSLRQNINALLTIATPEDEVLLILDSPGGIVHNYGFAASQLTRLKAHNIPLTISVDLIAASGGYMMACIANKIIAAPFAILGSIGVLAQIPNFNKLLTKFDVDIEHHTAGKHKSTLTMLGRNTSDARDKFREELEQTHILFKDFVKTNRPQLDIEQLATGEHWYGTTALDLKLIDAIQTSDDYLLEKSKTADIYQVSYVIHETIREKLNTMLLDSVSKIFNKITNFIYRANHCKM